MIKFKRLKSALVSSAVAVSAFVSPLAAVTPSLSANAADGDNYAKLLQYSLYFYDANMCGDNSDCALSWRGNCHTNDEVPGGFHDAGDHAMFGQPQGYTAATLGWAYYEFGDAFDSTGQTAHLKVITDKFAKFFRDATVLNGDTVQKVLIEKGEGNADHQYWGPPETQGDRGRMLWSTGGAANVTAEYAAALAANYVNFKNPDDLKYAKALYNFSKQNPATYSCEFYGSGESGSADELAWAAGWLYLATKDEGYLNDLKNGPLGYWVMNWENVALGAGVLLGSITGDWSHAPELGNLSGDGYKFYDKWGSARHNATAQMCSLVAAKHGKGDAGWAKGQMQYLTGDKAFANGQSYCLVCGFKPNASKNPHHRAASGTNSAAESNDGVQNKYTLIGALCGGPTDANGSYRDVRSDYVSNEVACDYNAGFVGAAAGLYSIYKTGSIETSIEGVTKIYGGNGSSNNNNNNNNNQQQTTTTTQPNNNNNNNNNNTTTTTKPNNNNNNNNSSSSSDGYTIKPNKKVTYSALGEDERMIGFPYEDFDIPTGTKITEVEVNISANKNIGKYVGQFGTSTTDKENGYWAMGDEITQSISGNSGTISWKVPSDIASIIQTQYGGEIKFGVWWIDCDDFTIDSVTLKTGSSSGSSSNNNNNNNNNTSNNNNSSSSSSDGYEIKPNKKVTYSALGEDERMIGFPYEDFDIPTGTKITEVEVNISANKNIGKYVGQFGTSTTDKENGYWAMGDEITQSISGNSGTISWKVPSDIASIIQTQYGGEIKFGVWWIDCDDFTIDAVRLKTSGSSSNNTTTTKATTTTTRTTTTTTKATTTTTTTTEAPKQDKPTLLGDSNCDGMVDLSDAVLIMQALANPNKYGKQGTGELHITEQGWINADVHQKGNGVSTNDALAIQMKLLGRISGFPIDVL